ncbi:hypothetical protein B0H19DRAFT_1073880 [Mycena capillaripes]|nr:hypothetical protein B0H19DRAFT_1073880 [Mycena capillaripes]
MKFHLSSAALIAACAFFSGKALAQVTAAQAVTNINTVTGLIENLNDQLNGLSPSSNPADVQIAAQTITNGFGAIITDMHQDVTTMHGTSPFDAADASSVAQAFSDFTLAQQGLMSALIGKQSIFAQFGVTGQISAALRGVEAANDSFAFSLIDVVPTVAAGVQGDKDSLDTAVGNAISLYGQLCIPSPLYPTVLPVCVPT